MRGLVFLGEREVALQEFADPSPGPSEVVIQIRTSGMCGSDLRPYRMPRGANSQFVCGHEPCGVVAEVGAGLASHQATKGQRVLIHHYRSEERRVGKECRS